MSYTAANEPMFDFGPGSQERKDLEEALKKYDTVTDVPIVIGDEEIRTNLVQKQVAVGIRTLKYHGFIFLNSNKMI